MANLPFPIRLARPPQNLLNLVLDSRQSSSKKAEQKEIFTKMSGAYVVGQLVEKMGNTDKDYRFMAINDLMRHVGSGQIMLEEDSTVKVVRALLKALDDTNGEVQNLAIKCIGMLAQPSRVRIGHLETIIDAVTPQLTAKNDVTRDVHCMTIKSIIQNLAPANHTSSNVSIIKRIVPKLTEAIRSSTLDDSACVDIIDILADLLLRFGESIPDLHQSIHDVLRDQLASTRQAVRKRATIAFGYLAAVASSELYDSMVAGLLQKLGTAKGPVMCRTYVIALTFTAKSSGTKFSGHLSKVVPYLIQFLRSSEDDELKEAACQGLEVFLYRCPNEVHAFQTDVQQVLSSNLVFDPNYEYGDEDEDEEMEEDDEDGDFSDDEDMTWKVRRAASKAIEAMMSSNRDSLLSYLTNIGPLLVSRFKEREETVRTEVLSAYTALLTQVALVMPNIQNCVVKSGSECSGDVEMQSEDTNVTTIGTTRFSTYSLTQEQLAFVRALAEQKDKMLRSVAKLLKSHPKSGPKCLELLTALVKVFPGSLEGHLPDLVPGVSRVMSDKTATAQGKQIALLFVSRALALHDPKMFEPMLNPLVAIICNSIEDPFYKVAGEGLLLASKYADIIVVCADHSTAAKQLFAAVFKKYISNDTDQEVRERSILAMSHLVAVFKDELSVEEVKPVIEKLTERVGREMTCLVATRGMSEIIAARVHVDEALIRQVLVNVNEYLKKMSRSLRIASLTLTQNLEKSHDVISIPQHEMSVVLSELPELINDNDLQITNQALECLAYAFLHLPQCIGKNLQSVLDATVNIIKSPLLQTATQTALMELVSSIVKSNIDNKPNFEQLLDTITGPVYDNASLSRVAHVAISSCASVVAAATNDIVKGRSLATKLAEQIKDKNSNETIRLFAISTLGELGRRFPQVYEAIDFRPEQLAMEAFNSTAEDLKATAAHALGALAVGNLPKFMPFILEQIRTQPKKQYLLLHALKEVIVWESTDSSSPELFRSAIEDIWSLLMNHAGGEEGTRNVVAECLGRLCAFDSVNLLPKLKEHVQSPNAHVRCAVVSAIKFMINDDRRNIDATLQRSMGDFLVTIRDSNLMVRRMALVVLNSAAHNKSALIRELLSDLLPAVYSETVINKDLMREVEMGPFKHQVDDGLDLRKCAFECMYTLLETCVDKIEIPEFLSVMEVGLKDPSHDVKLLNYLTLQKVVIIAPGQILQRLERICEALKAQLSVRSRSNAVKQELEKLEELKKAAIRVIFTLKQRLPDIERQQQFFELYNFVKHDKDLQTIAEAVVNESQRAVVYDVPMETA